MNLQYDYVCAIKTQHIQECLVAQALNTLGSDCGYVHLSKPIQDAYTKLVKSLLTPSQFELLEYWMYECDFGDSDREIHIDNKWYVIRDLTLLNSWN